MKLLIEESSWSGWDKNYKPNIINHEYEIILHKKYVVKTSKISYLKDGKHIEENKESFSVVIEEIGEDYIFIKTNIPMSLDKGASINLNTKDTIFKIELNKITKLVTPTTDCGEIYDISLR